MSSPQRPFKFNPHVEISVADLAAIVASHDQLQGWNNLAEQALGGVGDQPDSQVVKNIQRTAALIMRSEKVVSSQNFELMRAMNLFDKTLSPTEMAKGFVEGSWNELLDEVKKAVSFTNPGDMNLQHSQARTDALLSEPGKIAGAAAALLQRPAIVTQAMQQGAQVKMTETVMGLAANMVDVDPSHAVGAALGAAATGMVIGSFNPAGKGNTLAMTAEKAAAKPLDWHEYATLLGGGSYPPPLRPSRDFSDLMKIEAPMFGRGQARVTYTPSKSHKIVAEVFPDYGMKFLVKAQDDREKHGSGTEMFLSAMKKFRERGVDVSLIKADWDEGALGTNWQQFMDAYQAGASHNEAFKRTFTGRMAGRLGLTSVEMKDLDWALASESPNLSPQFKRPDWGKDRAWNDYANAWVSSQGRPALELMPRDAVCATAKSVHAIPAELRQQVEMLPVGQREAVLKQLEGNFANQVNPAKATITQIDDLGKER